MVWSRGGDGELLGLGFGLGPSAGLLQPVLRWGCAWVGNASSWKINCFMTIFWPGGASSREIPPISHNLLAFPWVLCKLMSLYRPLEGVPMPSSSTTHRTPAQESRRPWTQSRLFFLLAISDKAGAILAPMARSSVLACIICLC